jgi:bis(5'-adenosyl)-triphosphatase
MQIHLTACPFCHKNIQRAQFAESGGFRAIYNRAPILPGHSLIIPKQHIESLMELTESELAEMTIFARKVTSSLSKIFHAEAFNWCLQDGLAAGQTVPHLHLHLIPRLPADLPSPGDWYPLLEKSETEIDSELRARLTPEQIDQIVQKISASLL